MPYRHRLPYAALGGFLAVILGVSLALAQEKKPPVLKDQPVSQGQKTPDKKGAKAEGQKNTPPPEQLTPALHQIESAIRELENQQRAAQEKGPTQHEIKDLKAQDDMAFWAKLMFIATMVAVGLTGFGIWLIKRTLDETSVAAKHTEGMLDEAKKTTEAAHAAIQATDKNAEHQLRAYVMISNPIWTYPIDDSNFAVSLVWENTGQTPARRCMARASQGVFKDGLPDAFDYPDKASERPTEISSIGNSKTQKLTVGFDRSDVEAALRGEKSLFVWSWIEYDDMFIGTSRHRTEVCLRIGVKAGGQEIEPAVTGPFNGIDDDCHHQTKT